MEITPQAAQILDDKNLLIKIELDENQNLVVNFYEQFPGFGHLVKSLPYDSGE